MSILQKKPDTLGRIVEVLSNRCDRVGVHIIVLASSTPWSNT